MPARSGFLDPIGTRQFPGSSGYWWSSPTNAVPNQAIAPGGLYPGDAARQRIGRDYGPDFDPYNQPNVSGPYSGWGPYGSVGTRYGGGDYRGGPAQYDPVTGRVRTDANPTGDPRFNSIVQPKYPGTNLNDVIGGLSKTLQDTPLPKYGDTLAQFQKASSAIPGAFSDYQNVVGPAAFDQYAAGQRAYDPQYAGLTKGYLGTSGGIGGRYDTATGGYEGGLTDLTARDYGQQANFDKAQEDVYGRIAAENQKAFSKYGIGTNSNAGLSSAGLAGLITSNSDAAVRLNLAKQQRMDEAMQREQQRLGLGYGAEQARAGFQLGRGQYDYAAQQADVARAQLNAQQVQALRTQTAGLSLDAALRQAPALAAAAESAARLQNLPVDDILKRAQTVEGLIRLLGQANYTGVELRGGANVSQPQYFNNNGLPNRYGPATGTGGGSTNGAAGGEMRYDPKTGQMRLYSRDEMNAVRASSPQYTGRGIVPNRYDQGGWAGGGFVGSGGEVTGVGNFGQGMDWNAAYDRGRTPQEQAYYDAVAGAYQ